MLQIAGFAPRKKTVKVDSLYTKHQHHFKDRERNVLHVFKIWYCSYTPKRHGTSGYLKNNSLTVKSDRPGRLT